MKKFAFILLAGLVGCIGAFVLFYLVGTASSRAMMRQPQPELAWLKKEFNLGDAEYSRIVAMHKEYLPRCAERCRVIEELNSKLKRLVDDSPTVTDEIQGVMAERARMRADCEAEMLRHFLEVSRTMPPEQGRRYLAWVEQQTFMRGEAMERHHHTDHGAHSSHQH
jgi:hypothetical protein